MGIKISEFLGSTSALSSSYLTIVQGSVNYKISVADFMSSVGVSGSIVQDGAVTGTPILDVAGTVNNIRNLESGNGIITSVSTENGATISHNFDADTTGEPILLNSATATPDIASLVAGQGVSLSTTNNAIEIEFNGIPTDVVVVNSASDFPEAVGGVITLEDDTAYRISGDVSVLTDRFVPGDNTVISGFDSAVSSLTYTGTGDMFSGQTESFKITQVTISCANGTLFDLTSVSGFGVVQFINATVSEVKTVGTVGGMAALQMTDVAWNSITAGGLLFTGANQVFVGTRNLFTIDVGTMFDLGTATFAQGWTLETCFCTLSAGTTFLDGLASSGNIGAGSLGTVFDTRFSGAGDPLSANITVDDARWQFFGNDAIQDSRADGLLSLTANATETVITVAGTPVLIAGTWVVERASQFTGTTAGRLTYNGVKNAVVPVTANMTANPVSGTNIQITFHLYKNGVAVARATQGNQITSTSPKNTTLVWQIELTSTDYVEIYASNDDTTSNVVVGSAKLRLD